MVRVWVVVVGLLGLAPTALGETLRMAVVAGNNAGNGLMPPLRYAENDAGKMARVLVELGELDQDNVLLLQGRTLREIVDAIAEVARRVSLARDNPELRVVLMFYFSGHSDGEALEVGRERLAYAHLKALLSGTHADVRLVIIDACRSGAGIAQKGARSVAPFAIKLADTLSTTGEAFITSSAADEAALESSEVMGSFFTHNLVSGLRGAADASGDRLVTLSEAYQFAYERTVAATSVLAAGSQHPTYDYRLSGQGELVLATLQRPTATLLMPESDRGLVSDVVRDQVVVEVPRGPAREVALPPGTYAVRLFRGGRAFGGRVTLTPGTRHQVDWETLAPSSAMVAVSAKGGPPSISSAVEPSAAREPVTLGLSLGLATSRVIPRGFDQRPLGPKYQLRLAMEPLTNEFTSFNMFGQPRAGRGRLTGTLVLALLGESSFDAQTAGQSDPNNEAGGHVRAGYRVNLDWSRVSLGLGLEASVGVLAQLYEQRVASFVFGLAPRAMLKVKLSNAVSLFADAEMLFLNVFVSYEREGQTVSERIWQSPMAASVGLAFAL